MVMLFTVILIYVELVQAVGNISWSNTSLKNRLENFQPSHAFLNNISFVITKNKNTWMKSYAPYQVKCPNSSIVRQANQQLCEKEANYIEERSKVTGRALEEFLSRHLYELDIEDLNLDDIRIALAFSGGGYRAMLIGKGVMNALDGRISENKLSNRLGGLLQSTAYIAGISGGSWLVMSNLLNNLESSKVFDSLLTKNLKDPLLEGVPSFNLNDISHFTNDQSGKKQSGILQLFKEIMNNKFKDLNNYNIYSYQQTIKKILKFYRNLHLEIQSKKRMGFSLSLTDYWGRALSRKLFPQSEKLPGVTFSATSKLSSFKKFNQPFPIICAIEAAFNGSHMTRSKKNEISSLTSHLVEFSPFEFGSWDGFLNAFVNLKYLGTNLTNGTSNGNCINGFDNAGFITGTSSSLFNSIFLYLQNYLEQKVEFQNGIQSIMNTLGFSKTKTLKNTEYPEYALFSPNPFYQFHKPSLTTEAKNMYLMDGGSDGQNIPFHPFLQKARKIDILITFDFTGDLQNYPNGTSLIKSSEKYKTFSNMEDSPPVFKLPNGTYKQVFPRVPTCETFVTRKLERAPIFFGCNIEDYANVEEEVIKSAGTRVFEDYIPPLIVYIANTNHSFYSNSSTFQLSYSEREITGMINNGYNLATYLNGTVENFADCLSCAIVKRYFTMQNKPMPSKCDECFKRYCWDNRNSI